MLKSTVGCGSFGSHAAQRQRKALSRWSLLGSSSGAFCDWLSVCLCAVSVCVCGKCYDWMCMAEHADGTFQ